MRDDRRDLELFDNGIGAILGRGETLKAVHDTTVRRLIARRDRVRSESGS
jgi:hypothetical protein